MEIRATMQVGGLKLSTLLFHLILLCYHYFSLFLTSYNLTVDECEDRHV